MQRRDRVEIDSPIGRRTVGTGQIGIRLGDLRVADEVIDPLVRVEAIRTERAPSP